MPSPIPPYRPPSSTAPTRPGSAAPKPAEPKPAGAPKPTASRDSLSLSPQNQSLERLKAQLEAPLPPAPAMAATATDWKSRDQANRQALIKTLRADPGVMAGLAAWKKLPQDLQLKLGDRVSAIQASIYGFKPASLRFEDGPYRGNFNPGNGGTITIGPKSMVSAREFLNTVVHEQAHALQWEKGNLVVTKKLDPKDPYADIAPTWIDNFYDYTPPSEGYRAYRDQPTEAHAFATGDQVSAAVMSKP